HTSFSDGHASFEDNVRAAAAAGCRVMVSTDHLTLPASTDANCEVQVVEGDLPAHRLAFEDARKLAAQIAPELELIYGFECDWYEGCEPLVERWSAGAIVRLGSVHWIGDPGDIMAGAAGTAGTENVARPDTPIPFAVGSTTTPTCTFGKTWGYAACGSATSTTGAALAKAHSTLT
ncbi:MAG: hypothetical protein ACLTXI_13715, partial [Collinsella sp.]